jgi:AraC-like DNA-binding protein
MPFDVLVSQSFECKLSGYYRIDKDLYDECLNGLPAYTNVLICGIDPATNEREISYFLPQGEIFDKKKLIELFYKPYIFELIFFDALLEGIPVFGIPAISGFKVNSMERLSTFCSLVSFENRNSYLFKDMIVSATLEKISLYILRDLSASHRELFDRIYQHFDNDRLMKILSHIHLHLQEDITLDGLAGLVFLSADYISQFFKRCIGMSIQSYLIDQRVKLGLHMLVSTSDQIATISDNTGFVDQAYFNRRFKMFYEVNPLRMRKKYQLLFISQAGALMAWPKS